MKHMPSIASVAAILLAGACSHRSPDAPTPPAGNPELTTMWLDARVFGIVGDGVADDTAALRRAIAAACDENNGQALRQLALPPGTYRITDTITLSRDHNSMILRGTGGIDRTKLLWDGPADGNLIEAWALAHFQMYDITLDGNQKAGIIFRLNSTDTTMTQNREWLTKFGQRAATGLHFERIRFVRARTGMELSDSSYINSDCSTFINPGFAHLDTGFKANSNQNLAFLFLRPDFGWVGTCFHFRGGGYVKAAVVNCHHVDTVFHLEGAGINSGVFDLSTVRPEQGAKTKGKLPVTLRATGETNVKFTALQTTCCDVFGPDADLDTPTFILGPSANVVVESSHLCGRIAELTGDPAGVPTWIEFRNCRFRCAADPRHDITADDFSGYEFRNCIVTKDDTKGEKYQIFETIMLPHLVKYPRQAAGQPGHPAQ